MSTTAIATNATQTDKPQISIGSRGIILAGIDDLWRWSQYVVASGLAPKGMEKPESIFVATQMGLEVGLTPMAAIQNIAPINGRPTLWGDAQLAVVRSTNQLEEFEEWYEANGERLPRNPAAFDDGTVAICRVKRAGYKPAETAFSVADAKRAGLWGKQGPWSQYPARMLKFRARSFGLRDNFGDALKGMISSEEAMDLPPMKNITPARDGNVPLIIGRLPQAETTAAPAETSDAPTVNHARAIKLSLPGIGSTEAKLLQFLRDNGMIDDSLSSIDEIAEVKPKVLEHVHNVWADVAAAIGKKEGCAK